MDKQALRDLLKGRRELIDPERHGFVRTSRQGRRARGLSQHQVDELLHRTPGVYHRLEAGANPNPTDDLLRAVALLFGLDEQEWTSLNLYARGAEPPGPLYPRSGKEVQGGWQQFIDGMEHMAYVTDCSWQIVAHNQACAGLFPDGVVPTNAMRWMLLSPQAKTILVDWEHAWAPFVLPQLRAALAARPDDPILQAIERDVIDDPLTQPIYESGIAYIHPDGDERPMFHAQWGTGWVTMCAAQPLGAPGARLVGLVFRAGEQRMHPRPPLLRAG